MSFKLCEFYFASQAVDQTRARKIGTKKVDCPMKIVMEERIYFPREDVKVKTYFDSNQSSLITSNIFTLNHLPCDL